MSAVKKRTARVSVQPGESRDGGREGGREAGREGGTGGESGRRGRVLSRCSRGVGELQTGSASTD